MPLTLGSFIAREEETNQISALITSSRLVTLTGPAGIGKTRLALEVATDSDAFQDGVYLAELAQVREGQLVAPTVASALGVAEERESALIDTLITRLVGQRLLLVLDNCEHVLQATAELIHGLLRNCPRISVLATSQEPLGIPGEVVRGVPGLTIPDSADIPIEALKAYEAVRLFLERASARSGFELTDENAADVARICQRLNGVPLAIELAAARTGVLGPAEILERLDDRFKLLTQGNRSADPRHRTLESALDWSFGLLTNEEQTLLRRLGAFAGSFTPEAARRVCSGSGLDPDKVLDLLESLTVKSLVVAQSDRGNKRFRLLETIREYARGRLAEAQEELVFSRRHAEWALDVVESGQSPRDEQWHSDWMHLFEIEHDNLRAALEWTLSQGRQTDSVRLATGLGLFWSYRGHLTEGRQFFARVLENTAGVPPDLRVAALTEAARVVSVMGDFQSAVNLAEEALDISRKTGDRPGTIRAFTSLGFSRLFLEDPEKALPILEEGVGMARDTGDVAAITGILTAAARAHLFHGDLNRAKALFEEELEVSRTGQDKRSAGDALVGLGWVAMMRGELLPAACFLEKGLELSKEVGDKYVRALGLGLMGEVTALRGAYEKTRRLLEESLEVAGPVGCPYPRARALGGLGGLALAQEDLPQAAALLDQALSAVRFTGHKYTLPQYIAKLALVRHLEGDRSEASSLAQQALELSQANKDAWSAGRCLNVAGIIAAANGEHERATMLHHQALSSQKEIGDQAGMVDSLESLAELGRRTGRVSFAIRLLASAETLRTKIDYARPAVFKKEHEATLSALRRKLPAREFESVWGEGSALSAHEAFSYASKGRGRRRRPSTGWDSLTKAELATIALVQEGLSNQEIAERLFISVRTVGSHLTHIFRKLKVRNRRELARLAQNRT